MKRVLLKAYRLVVGYERGFNGEGSEQWYYFIALVMNCMLTWWLKPELGVLITVCSVIHFAMTIICGLGDLTDFLANKRCFLYSVLYFSIHLVMFVVCACFNWWWTLITSAIVVISFCIGIDCMGYNTFMRPPKDYDVDYGNDNWVGIFLCHTIWFAIFVTITMLLPISIWIRIGIIVVCMILHPIIDYLEGECINIKDITDEAFDQIMSKIKPEKYIVSSKSEKCAIEEKSSNPPIVVQEDNGNVV